MKCSQKTVGFQEKESAALLSAGVIGGGAGAILAASSAQKSIAKIVIYTSDITTPSVTIDLYAKKNDTWDFDNERDAFAQQVCASIKAIIANQ